MNNYSQRSIYVPHPMREPTLTSSLSPLLRGPAGDGVLWRRFHHRSGEEHQGQHAEGGLDRLHLPRDPQGQSGTSTSPITLEVTELNTQFL